MTVATNTAVNDSRANDPAAARSSSLGIRWVYPDPTGSFTPLSGRRVKLGRDEVCDRVLPGIEVSRVHAEVVDESHQFHLRDLGSTNGVSVNGARVGEALLALGDVIRVGEWIGVFAERLDDEVGPIFETVADDLVLGPVLRRRLAILQKLAPTNLPILLLGETGTGKEVVAQHLHRESKRGGQYKAVNCAALPESLAEAELFGYAKGAFTGAARAHSGYFRQASNGTLLLDEIVELPLNIQPKLLRALEQSEVQPIGDGTLHAVDVRIVAAAQEDLAQLVADKRFRADLFARLNGTTIRLPPVRERREEIPYLFRVLFERAGGQVPQMKPGFVESLCCHDWPGNVRELALAARRLCALGGSDRALRRADWEQLAAPGKTSVQPPPTGTGKKSRGASDPALRALLAALRSCAGNVTHAADKVGISRQRAYRLLEGTDLDSVRAGE